MQRYIGQAWLVIILALCFGGALAGVQASLQGRIEENRLAETISQIPNLVPGAQGGEETVVAERKAYRAITDGKQVGWVVSAGGQGFADRIELLIGLNPDATTLTGLYVLEQKETPGLGNKIVEADWRNQFANRATNMLLKVTKTKTAGGDEIRSVTGATISSESVCEIVNGTVADLRDALAAGVIRE